MRAPLSATNVFLQAYSRKEADVFSFTSNQAALAVPTASGQFGLSGRYMGNSTHYQAEAGLAYARKLTSWVDIGAQFNYYKVKPAGFSSTGTIYFEAGALVHLGEQINIGIHARNPTAAAVGHVEEELLPFVYSAGVGYEVSEELFVAGEVQKATGAKAGINTGMQYRFDDRLWARAGFYSASSSYMLAVGCGLKDLKLEVVGSVHPQLGLTPGLQLIFHQKEKTP